MQKRIRKTNKIVYILHFLFSIIAAIILFSILLIYHGPFTKLRDYIVSTSMATNDNKMFATWFLDQKEIDKILAYTNSQVKNGIEDPNNIVIQKAQGTQTTGAATTGTDTRGAVPSTVPAREVNIIDVSGKTFKGKLMVIDDPSRIVLGLAPKLGQVGAPLSEIVKVNNAAGGVNAGGFLDDNFLGTGATPDGIVIQDGEIKYQQTKLNSFEIIGFTKNNVLLVSNGMSLDEIAKSDLRCAISFGPVLIANGEALVQSGGTSLQPRSAIAQKKDGTILILAIDGRSTASQGANYKDVQDVLLQYGAYNAANLDGGSSTTMNYSGKTINNPCDITGERSIASAFLIMP
jgi:exopolysaccharide biosynthesis protein